VGGASTPFTKAAKQLSDLSAIELGTRAVDGLLQMDPASVESDGLPAFAGQVACNLAAWEQGWKEPAIGRPATERINVNGSSIAIGHPFAATGARIVTSLGYELRRRQAKRGLVSICAAGAQAAALILER